MRLEVTRRADLAAHALVVLSQAEGRLKAAELAERIGTTAGYVPQVLAPLVERSWVQSDPGPTGGYRVLVPLDALSVLDVIESVDGPTDAGRCVVENRPCDGRATCSLHVAWARAREALVSELGATPLTTLAAAGAEP